MNYWVIKGRPTENDFDRFLKPGQLHCWYTGRPPKHWSEGDRLFFWRGAPACEVIALGEFRGLTGEVADDGKPLFEVRYQTSVLSRPVGIQSLRADDVVGSASFLKRGPSGTVFPLSTRQAARIYRMVRSRNRDTNHVWPDLLKVGGRSGE
jgi:hypothetical protein